MSAELQVTLSLPVEAAGPIAAVKEFIASVQDGHRTDYVYIVESDTHVTLVDTEDWSTISHRRTDSHRVNREGRTS